MAGLKALKPRLPLVQHSRVAALASAGSVERTRGRAWMELRERILRRDNGLCLDCRAAGRVRLACEVDHNVPLYAGGTDDEDNLRSLCASCHEAKSRREAAERGGQQAV